MKKILIIDNDSNIRLLLSSTLMANPEYQILEAEDGLKGLEIARREIPDLILLDVNMPQMDGYEVCRQLKGSPETKNIKIIMLTGFDNEEARKRGLEAGADDYFTKPFRPTTLLSKISERLPGYESHIQKSEMTEEESRLYAKALGKLYQEEQLLRHELEMEKRILEYRVGELTDLNQMFQSFVNQYHELLKNWNSLLGAISDLYTQAQTFEQKIIEFNKTQESDKKD